MKNKLNKGLFFYFCLFRPKIKVFSFLAWNQIVFIFVDFEFTSFSFCGIIIMGSGARFIYKNRNQIVFVFWKQIIFTLGEIRSFWNWDVFKLAHFKPKFARFRLTPIIYIRIIKKLHITRIWSLYGGFTKYW